MAGLDVELEAGRYFARPGRFTVLDQRTVTELRGHDLAQLVAVVQGLLVYDLAAAPFYGFEPPPERSDDIHVRPAADLVGIARRLADRPLVEARPPQARALGRCRSYAVLLVAFLRAAAVPARARCGFASYFTDDTFEDHWIVECRLAGDRRWRRVDAQLDAVWQAHLARDVDPLDLPPGAFVSAAEGWRQSVDPQQAARFGVSSAGLFGRWFVGGSLVRDLAALNRQEFLPWDVWGAQSGPDRAPDEPTFDELAAALDHEDQLQPEVLQALFHDPRFAVGDQVVNALADRVDQLEPWSEPG